MSTNEFAWLPDTLGELSHEPNVSSLKFGDGYELRMPDGINSTPQNWKLTFTRPRTVALEINEFLRKMGAVNSFVWKTPHGETGRYVCRKWTCVGVDGKTGDVLRVSADFEQVFEN